MVPPPPPVLLLVPSPCISSSLPTTQHLYYSIADYDTCDLHSNFGFFNTFTFLMKTSWRGNIGLHFLSMSRPMLSGFLKMKIDKWALHFINERKNTNSMYHLQFVNNFFEINSWYLFHHDLDHSSSDVAYLRWLCITCFLDLVWLLLGEANTEQTKVVTIGGLNISRRFNKCLR